MLVIAGQWFINHERDNEQSLAKSQLKQENTIIKKQLTISKAKQEVAERDLKTVYDTLKNERISTRKNVIVKVVYRDKLKEAAKDDLAKSPETITRLVAADDSLTITFMNALDKCEAGYDTLKTKFIVYRASADSVQSNLQDLNSNSEVIIEDQENQIKRSKRLAKVLKVAVPVALVLGVVIGL